MCVQKGTQLNPKVKPDSVSSQQGRLLARRPRGHRLCRREGVDTACSAASEMKQGLSQADIPGWVPRVSYLCLDTGQVTSPLFVAC